MGVGERKKLLKSFGMGKQWSSKAKILSQISIRKKKEKKMFITQKISLYRDGSGLSFGDSAVHVAAEKDE